MQTPSLCTHCGQNGAVRREAIIKGDRVVILFYCAACARRWETTDQRKMPGPGDAPRERRAHPR